MRFNSRFIRHCGLPEIWYLLIVSELISIDTYSFEKLVSSAGPFLTCWYQSFRGYLTQILLISFWNVNLECLGLSGTKSFEPILSRIRGRRRVPSLWHRNTLSLMQLLLQFWNSIQRKDVSNLASVTSIHSTKYIVIYFDYESPRRPELRACGGSPDKQANYIKKGCSHMQETMSDHPYVVSSCPQHSRTLLSSAHASLYLIGRSAMAGV